MFGRNSPVIASVDDALCRLFSHFGELPWRGCKSASKRDSKAVCRRFFREPSGLTIRYHFDHSSLAGCNHRQSTLHGLHARIRKIVPAGRDNRNARPREKFRQRGSRHFPMESELLFNGSGNCAINKLFAQDAVRADDVGADEFKPGRPVLFSDSNGRVDPLQYPFAFFQPANITDAAVCPDVSTALNFWRVSQRIRNDLYGPAGKIVLRFRLPGEKIGSDTGAYQQPEYCKSPFDWLSANGGGARFHSL